GDSIGDVLDPPLGRAVGDGADQKDLAVGDRDLDVGGVDLGVDGEDDVDLVGDRFVGPTITARAAAAVATREVMLELDAGIVEVGVFTLVDAAAVEGGIGAVTLVGGVRPRGPRFVEGAGEPGTLADVARVAES